MENRETATSGRVTRRRRLPGWAGILVLLLVVGGMALVTRLPELDTAPPGFADDEARTALYARDIAWQEMPLRPTTAEPGAREPLFAVWLKVTGSISSWSVTGARAASALAGALLAVACALWYRQVFGLFWASVGGLLVATSFWQIVASRQVSAGVAGAACASLALWCLWRGLGPASETGPEQPPWQGWCPAAALLFGLAVYSYAPLLLLVPLVLLASALLIRHRLRSEAGVGWLGPAIGLVLLLAIVAPVATEAATEPAAAGQRIERSPIVRDETDAGGTLNALARGGGVSLRSIVWEGQATHRLTLNGRPLLDPLLAAWCLGGIAYALYHARHALHQVALAWLVGWVLLSALIEPGNPELLLPAAPVIFLLPLLAMRAVVHLAQRRSPVAGWLAIAAVALSLTGSAVWSLYDYRQQWLPSAEVYRAFNGDVRDALAVAGALPDRGEPVYFSTWNASDLLRYLSLGEPDSQRRRDVDGRTTLVIPETGGGYLVFPSSSTPNAQLMAYVRGRDGLEPVAIGTAPDGSTAWEVWRVGQPAREALPSTIPTIRFPNRIQLVGVAIAPELGDVATTGQLPDPPRVAVTLVWSVPAGIAPHQVEVRLVPVDQPDDPAQITSATSWLPNLPGLRPSEGRQRERIVTRLSVVVPDTEDLIVDVLAGLIGADGSRRAPYGPPAVTSGDYAFLNRIQYRTDTR